MSNYAKAIIAVIIASVFWGSAGIVAKVLLVHFDPFTIALLRAILASVFILPIFFRQKLPSFGSIIKDIVPISMLSAINIGIYYIGMQRTTVNASAVMYAATPLLVTIIATVTIHEQMSVKKIVGIIIGFIGVLSFLILPELGRGDVGFGTPVGNLILLVAILSWSGYIVGSRYLTNTKRYNPMLITSVSMFTSVVFLLIVNLFVPHHIETAAFTNFTIIANFLYLGLFVTVVTYVLFQWAIGQLSSTTASLTNYLQPIFAFFFAWIFLGERITPAFLFGSLLVLLGVFIVTGDRLLEHVRLFKAKRRNG